MDSNQFVKVDNHELAGKYLTFSLNERDYAMSITKVREINQISEITPVPESPHYVNGVINMRGQVIPVVDLAVKFGLPKKEYNNRTCIVVTETKYGLVGVIVEKVSEVLQLEPEHIDANPVDKGSDRDYLLGLGKVKEQLLVLIDIEVALSLEALRSLDFSA